MYIVSMGFPAGGLRFSITSLQNSMLDSAFSVVPGMMTSTPLSPILATDDCSMFDVGHRDLRRDRSASFNVVSTTTGAAKIVALVVPSLIGRLDEIALCVPTSNPSVCNGPSFLEGVSGASVKTSGSAVKRTLL